MLYKVVIKILPSRFFLVGDNMSGWKVLIILFLGCVSLGLAMATIAIPIAQDGAQKWIWGLGLLIATLGSGAVLTLYLRLAGRSLDGKARG